MKRVCILVALCWLLSLPVTAASDTPATQTRAYPDRIEFALLEDVYAARLVITATWPGGGSWEISPSRGHTGYSVSFDTAEIAPFTELRYYWEGTRVDMTMFATPESTVEVLAWGARDWQRVENAMAMVLWYGQPAAFGQAVLAATTAHSAALQRELGRGLPGQVRVVIYSQQFDYCGEICGNSGGQAHDTGVIVAWPCAGSSAYLFDYVLPHELAHLWLQPYRARLPVWFTEGFAEMATGQGQQLPQQSWEWRALQYRAYASPEEMRDWYAQAGSLVDWLHANTTGGLPAILAAIDAGADFESALRATFGMNSAQALQAWRGVEVAQTPAAAWWPLALDSAQKSRLLWVVIGLLVVAIVLVRQSNFAEDE